MKNLTLNPQQEKVYATTLALALINFHKQVQEIFPNVSISMEEALKLYKLKLSHTS